MALLAVFPDFSSSSAFFGKRYRHFADSHQLPPEQIKICPANQKVGLRT
jgi:hypothetical protein